MANINVPLNQIVYKYTTGNEYMYVNTYEQYQGYYYEFNNNVFAGKQFSTAAPKLMKIDDKKANPYLKDPLTKDYGRVINSSLNSDKDFENTNFDPPYYHFKPGVYDRFANRYFVRKTDSINDPIKEISKESYDKVKSNPLYDRVEIYWDTFSDNEEVLDKTDLEFPGIKAFFEGTFGSIPDDLDDYFGDEEALIEEEKSASNENKSIIVHKGNSGNSFAIIFGGTPSSKYGAKWLESKGKIYLGGKNVAYSDWEKTIPEVTSFIQSNYPGATINSISGFSKGGRRAWPAVGKYNFVGLIDPSIEGDYTIIKTVPPEAKVILTYLPTRTWGRAGLDYAIEKLGTSRVVGINKIHDDQPEEFFKRYFSVL